MSPEYLDELADLADPDKLWQLAPYAQMDLPKDKRAQLDAGVALRRYASHRRQLAAALAERKSLLITPLSSNGSASMLIHTPSEHVVLRRDEREPAINLPAGEI